MKCVNIGMQYMQAFCFDGWLIDISHLVTDVHIFVQEKNDYYSKDSNKNILQ